MLLERKECGTCTQALLTMLLYRCYVMAKAARDIQNHLPVACKGDTKCYFLFIGVTGKNHYFKLNDTCSLQSTIVRTRGWLLKDSLITVELFAHLARFVPIFGTFYEVFGGLIIKTTGVSNTETQHFSWA